MNLARIVRPSNGPYLFLNNLKNNIILNHTFLLTHGMDLILAFDGFFLGEKEVEI